MKLVVVGGHCRNIGKTSVMAGLIRELEPLPWTAVKITQHKHDIHSGNGGRPDGAPIEQAFVLTEETTPHGRGDTCRYLAAGARRSLWLRVRGGRLRAALSSLADALRGDEYAIIESNSILGYWKPTAYIVVLDNTRRDFKASARRFLARADALVPVAFHLDSALACGCVPPTTAWRDAKRRYRWTASWPEALCRILKERPVFPVGPPDYQNSGLSRFVRQKLRDPARAQTPIPFANVSPTAETKEQPWQR